MYKNKTNKSKWIQYTIGTIRDAYTCYKLKPETWWSIRASNKTPNWCIQ